MQDLRPIPLRAVRAATLGQITDPAARGPVGDFGGLRMAGMVFPQPGVGGQLALEPRLQCQRHPLPVDRNGRGTGCVHADTDHLLRAKAALSAGRRHRAADRPIEALDVVGRVLTRQIGVLRVQQDSRSPATVVVHVGADLGTVSHIDHQCADAVGAVIDANCKLSA